MVAFADFLRNTLFDMRILPLFLGFALVLMGCATSSAPVEKKYDETSERTTYTTDEIRLDGVEATSGLSKKNRYYVQVQGVCSGQDCVPARYTLDFVKEGTQPIKLTGRDVTLTVGTETMAWNDPQNRRVTQTSVIRNGTFVTVQVSQKQLVTIGSVSEVTGSVGNISFQMSHGERAPIRTLLSGLDLSSEADSLASSSR